MISAAEKKIKPKTARILAAVFLLAGVALGFFDAPRYAVRALDKAGLGFLSSKPEYFGSRLSYRFGLDIQGGVHLVYQADLSNISTSAYADSMDAARDVIERRINLFGVAEPVVQVERVGEDWRLIVELAGVKDVGAAIALIGETPYLEFWEERRPEERDVILEAQKNGERLAENPYFVPTALTGRNLKRAEVDFDPTAFQPQVSLELDGDGANLFAEITRKNVGKRVAIFLDGAPISAPLVQEEITGGKAQITGNFTPQSAKELAGRMSAGALPVPLKLLVQQSVGASLGEESLGRSLKAGLFGFAAVAVFMILWYRLPGVIAVAALLFYAAIVLAVFKLIPVTLTVAGIAGFILSVGMAVDANILIFERMKEELRAGKTMDEAIRNGFGRAWTSIRDSNVSSLITCAVLYWFGFGMVRGFALTLAVGIIISMFSAISVTRTVLIAVLNKKLEAARPIFLSGISK